MTENENDRQDDESITEGGTPVPDDAKPGFEAVQEQAKQDREEGASPDAEPRVPFDEA